MQYLANGTRLDISYFVCKLARYTSCLHKSYCDALDSVLRYPKDTISRFALQDVLWCAWGYNDASWMAKRSNSNGVTRFTLVGGVVTWNSTRQTIITRFAFEAELCINVMWTKADWLHGLMLRKPVVSRPLPAIPVHCDSLTTIDMIRKV